MLNLDQKLIENSQFIVKIFKKYHYGPISQKTASAAILKIPVLETRDHL
jgi:hypothetical protein